MPEDYLGKLTGPEIDALPERITHVESDLQKIKEGDTVVGLSQATLTIQTEDNIMVKDKAIISTTGGNKDINQAPEGFVAKLLNIRGNSSVEGEFAHSTITNEYTPEGEGEYDYLVTVVDNNKFTAAVIENSLAGTGITIETIQAWLLLDYGLSESGSPVGTETFTVTDPTYQTVVFPTITSFNSTQWNLLNEGSAKVIEGHRYMVVASSESTVPTVTLNEEAQTLGEYICERGHTIPYSFVASGTGTVTVTGASVLALIWSGKYCNRTTDATYALSTISIPNDYQTLRAIGTTYDELTPTLYRKRIYSVSLTGENLIITADKERIVTSTDIYYVSELQVGALALNWDFNANDFGEVYFEFSANAMPIEYTAVYGDNLVDKLARDVLTKSSQPLTDAEKAQVYTNLGLQHTVFTVTYTDGSTVAINLVGYVE